MALPLSSLKPSVRLVTSNFQFLVAVVLDGCQRGRREGENFFLFLPSQPVNQPCFQGLSSPGNEGACIQAGRILRSAFSGSALPCCKAHFVGNEQKDVVLRAIWRKEIGRQDYMAEGGRVGCKPLFFNRTLYILCPPPTPQSEHCIGPTCHMWCDFSFSKVELIIADTVCPFKISQQQLVIKPKSSTLNFMVHKDEARYY